MKRPNILFIHADQLHHKAISAYGNPYVMTPNIDRIVNNGYSFMQMHTAMPQCCPARASWYTGRMSKEHGVVINAFPINPKIPDLGQWLGKSNYETVYTGKWHVSGRDVSKSFKVLHRGSGRGEEGDSLVARSAVAFLKNRKSNKPFFLNVGFLNPHDCCFPAGAHGGIGKFAFAKQIKDKLPPLPDNFDYKNYKTNSYSQRTRDWELIHWQYYIYLYYRMVEMVDHEVGRVYNALMDSPYKDNTVLIFTSDHGDGLGFHSKLSKGFLEEEAWRVPAVICAPGAEKNVRDSNHLVTGVDIPATICDYAGTSPLPDMTIGKSWRPIIEKKDPKWRKYVVGETSIRDLAVAIRDKEYKTIFYSEKETKLYDILNDPLEMKNLAKENKYKDILKKHKKYFKEYINSIKICTMPTWKKRKSKNPKIYDDYTLWYDSIRKGS